MCLLISGLSFVYPFNLGWVVGFFSESLVQSMLNARGLNL